MRGLISFLKATTAEALRGGWVYRAWVGLLVVGGLVGLGAYLHQLDSGLGVTSMNDHVSWGMYIGNFTFGVGLAAAAVMVVIPAYLYRSRPFKEIVFIGEFLAVAAVTMCLLFVTVDIGRPDRAWHLIPFVGKLNLPRSMLAWDVVVLSGYLVINGYLLAYASYSKYFGRRPNPRRYIPVIFISMFWAVSLHTVTAFLYSWLGARPFWNSAIVAPRFLVSAFVSGPAFLIIALQVIRRTTNFFIKDDAIRLLRKIVAVTMTINLFLFGAELFNELFTTSHHRASAAFLLFGHEEHRALVPWIWTAILFNTTAAIVFSTRIGHRRWLLNVACCLAFVGVGIEKGMGLVVPGFVPDTLGEYTVYHPSWVEVAVSLGIWAIGLLVFTVLVKVGVPLEQGWLHDKDSPQLTPSIPPPEAS